LGRRCQAEFRALKSGTPAAQAFVLLHELAHYFQAHGFVSENINGKTDLGKEKSNNDLIWKNCAKTIKGGNL